VSDRAAFVRESMRRSWGGRTEAYARGAVRNNAPFAELLIERVGLRPGRRVLDVATGPGLVALLAARAVAPDGQVVATDLVSEWEPIVAARAAEAGVDNVAFRVMSADALELPDGSFDATLCQFGLMFVPEPLEALREMRRVLRPGGRLGLVVWSTAEKVGLFSATAAVLEPYVPRPPPGQELPGPLSLGAPGLIERLAAEAGFRQVASERRTFDYAGEEPHERWQSSVLEGPPALRDAILALPEEERRGVRERFVAALEAYRRDGQIRLPSEGIVLTANR
jgi:SAM-dependent methyltransferase